MQLIFEMETTKDAYLAEWILQNVFCLFGCSKDNRLFLSLLDKLDADTCRQQEQQVKTVSSISKYQCWLNQVSLSSLLFMKPYSTTGLRLCYIANNITGLGFVPGQSNVGDPLFVYEWSVLSSFRTTYGGPAHRNMKGFGDHVNCKVYYFTSK